MGIVNWFRDRFNSEPAEEEIYRNCDKCGSDLPETSMVIYNDSLFCSECLTKHKKEKEEAEFRRKQALQNQKLKYYCYNCKFHFSRKKEFGIRLCPNCGSENFVAENEIIQ